MERSPSKARVAGRMMASPSIVVEDASVNGSPLPGIRPNPSEAVLPGAIGGAKEMSTRAMEYKPRPGLTMMETSARYRRGEAPEIEHLAAPQWSTKTFLLQLFYHVFCPLSTPFLFMFEKRPLVRNMGYCFELSAPFVLNYLIQFIVVGVNSAFVYRRYFDESGAPVPLYDEEIIAMNAFHILRYWLIAVKYGYVLSDPWWSERLNSRVLSQDERASLLLAVWNNPSKETMDRELKIAEQRVGERLRDHFFAFSEDGDDILKVKSGAELRGVRVGDAPTASAPTATLFPDATANGETAGNPAGAGGLAKRGGGNPGASRHAYVYSDISVHTFCERLIMRASLLTGELVAFRLFALVYALAPTFYRLAIGTDMSAGLDVFIITCNTIVLFVMFQGVLTFLQASTADYRRRAMCEQGLSIVVSDTLRDHTAIALHKSHSLSPTEKFVRSLDLVPQLDLTIPSNVHSFMIIHRVFRAMGLEFRDRIQVFNTAIFAFVALMLVSLIGQLLAGAEASAATYYFVFVTMGALSMCLSLMASAGVAANAEALVQHNALLRVKARIGRALSERSTMDCSHKRLTDANMLLDTAIQLIRSDDELQPTKILGIRASGSTLGGFVGAGLTLLALVIQIISLR